MQPEAVVRTVEDFLVSARDAVVMEEGVMAFDLANAKYSVSGEHNQVFCISSSERNLVRRVLDVAIKNDVLRLAVQRLGHARPTKLEICRERDRRTPTAKRATWVAWHREGGGLQHFGYFPGRELLADAPVLFLVAPALHVHPATDTWLRYFSAEIEWALLGMDERWRAGVRVGIPQAAGAGCGQPRT